MSDKPNIFVASSAEGISVADAVNIKLEYNARVKQWDNAFDLSSITISSLIEKTKDADYAVFIFHKDDKTTIRGNTYSVVRDNVLFELGLFIGALGIEKCFILLPKSKENEFRMPTDLAGVTTATYDDELDDMVDAVATSCGKIKNQIKKQQQQISPMEDEKQVIQNNEDILRMQLNEAQSQLWRLGHDFERSKEELTYHLQSISNHFHSVAKPATEAEIKAWEEGAKNSYLKEVKISRNKVYYVDKDIVIPPGYGAGSISVIIAKGVRVFGANQSHNSIYYMDGFRADSLLIR